MRRGSWVLAFGSIVLAAAAHAQPVSVTWPLNATTMQNPAPAPASVIVTPQVIAPGSGPAMSVFDYWPSHTPQAQRLYAGTSGWTAGSWSPARYIQFEVGPSPGTQLSISSVKFNYGGAQGAPNRMRSLVQVSTNNSTWTVLNPALNYPSTNFNGFSHLFNSPLNVAPGQKFTLRIHPYAIQNQTPTGPLFAAHHGVTIQGVSTPAPGAPDLAVTKSCTNQGQANNGVLCTITIKNNGTVPSLAPLTIVDTPTASPGSTLTGAGTTTGFPVGCSSGAGPVPPTISCTANATINPGAQHTVLISFQVPPGGSLGNCVTVTQPTPAGAAPDPNPSNNTNVCSTTVTQPPVNVADLSVTKSCAVIGPNRLVRCTISVVNSGPVPTPTPWNLQETLTGLPGGTQLVNIGAAGIACTGVSPPMTLSSPINCQLYNPVVPNAPPYVILVDFRPPQATTFHNCATVSHTGGTETNVSNNTACTTLAVP